MIRKLCPPICLMLALCVCWSSCRLRKSNEPAAATVRLEAAPLPPRIGPATITIDLIDVAGAPISGARVNVEGNMSHPGMPPAFGDARETSPGRYMATINFTMGGDWVILIQATLPNGQKLERQFDVKNVQTG